MWPFRRKPRVSDAEPFRSRGDVQLVVEGLDLLTEKLENDPEAPNREFRIARAQLIARRLER